MSVRYKPNRIVKSNVGRNSKKDYDIMIDEREDLESPD